MLKFFCFLIKIMRHYNNKLILKKKDNLFNLLLDYKFYYIYYINKYNRIFLFHLFLILKIFLLYIKNCIGKKIIFINIVSFKILFIIFEIKLINI